MKPSRLLVVEWLEAVMWVLHPRPWGFARGRRGRLVVSPGPLGPASLCVRVDIGDWCSHSLLMQQLRSLSFCRLDSAHACMYLICIIPSFA